MEIRIPASESENLPFGLGYTPTGVTFDADAQTIVLHVERGYDKPVPKLRVAVGGPADPGIDRSRGRSEIQAGSEAVDQLLPRP